MRNRAFSALILALALSLPAFAAESNYPARPVRMIVPFAPGGTFDLVARIVSAKLTKMWGEQIVVDNRPGGATILATEMAAQANPDGYTLYLSPNALAANPSLHKHLPYNAKRDFRPVTLLAAQPMALGASNEFKANGIKDLIAMAKAAPGFLSYGCAGIGSGGWLAGEIFKSMAKINIVAVGYKGGNLAMADVLSNQIPLVFTGLPNLLPLERAGKLKILAITDSKRSPVAKEIPTIAETVPGYEFRNWFGVVVPTGTPVAVQRKLSHDLNAVLADATIRNSLLQRGFDVIGGTSQAFAQQIERDTLRFAAVIKGTEIAQN